MKQKVSKSKLAVKAKKSLKLIEFTHFYTKNGLAEWIDKGDLNEESPKIVYLGKCTTDGDMFAVYRHDGDIDIWIGKLNDGVYEFK
jgi:hypothetical protein